MVSLRKHTLRIIRFFLTLRQNSLPACIACISVSVSNGYAEEEKEEENFVSRIAFLQSVLLQLVGNSTDIHATRTNFLVTRIRHTC